MLEYRHRVGNVVNVGRQVAYQRHRAALVQVLLPVTDLQAVKLNTWHLIEIKEAGKRDVTMLVDVVERRARPRYADMQFDVGDHPRRRDARDRVGNLLGLANLIIVQPERVGQADKRGPAVSRRVGIAGRDQIKIRDVPQAVHEGPHQLRLDVGVNVLGALAREFDEASKGQRVAKALIGGEKHRFAGFPLPFLVREDEKTVQSPFETKFEQLKPALILPGK